MTQCPIEGGSENCAMLTYFLSHPNKFLKKKLEYSTDIQILMTLSTLTLFFLFLGKTEITTRELKSKLNHCFFHARKLPTFILVVRRALLQHLRRTYLQKSAVLVFPPSTKIVTTYSPICRWSRREFPPSAEVLFSTTTIPRPPPTRTPLLLQEISNQIPSRSLGA